MEKKIPTMISYVNVPGLLSLKLILHHVLLMQFFTGHHGQHVSTASTPATTALTTEDPYPSFKSPEDPSVIDTIDIHQIKIELAYRGPDLKDGKITADFMWDLVRTFYERGKLHEKYVLEILRQARDYFRSLPNVVDLSLADNETIYVVGETHGDIYSLLNIFDVGGGAPNETTRYLFNGNMIDEDDHSIECLMLLLGFTLLYPHSVFLNRGTYETRSVISWHRSGCTSGHENWIGQECEQKYPAQKKLWGAFMEVFDWLPLAHVINGKVFVVHGGLASEDGVTLDDIRKITRNCEPNPKDVGKDRILYDLLYSSPQAKRGRGRTKYSEALEFGPDITKKFCKESGLQRIIRTHGRSGQKRSQHYNQVYWVSARYGGFMLRLRAPELEPKEIDLGSFIEPLYGLRWRGQGGYYQKYEEMKDTMITRYIPEPTEYYD